MAELSRRDFRDIAYVSRDIYDERGILLIAKGTVISENVIRFCQKRKIELNTCFQDPNATRKRKDTAVKMSEEILAKDLLVKFNYLDQKYAKYAPKLVNEVMQEIRSKTLVPFDVSVLYKNIRWVYAHSINVALLSAIFAEKLGINKINSRKIVIAALLHDIGKTIIPADIVNKTGELSSQETALLKQHPELGAGILANLGLGEEIQLIVKQHHELLNGEGYPQGITQGLHIYTQIIGVSNKFDSMLTDTHFKKASSLVEVLEEMERKKGGEYDAAVIDVLFQVFERKKMHH